MVGINTSLNNAVLNRLSARTIQQYARDLVTGSRVLVAMDMMSADGLAHHRRVTDQIVAFWDRKIEEGEPALGDALRRYSEAMQVLDE